MTMEDRIREKLLKTFTPIALEVIDDSEAHRGHGGYREGGGTHFNVNIKAEAFNGLNRVGQQRLINKALAQEFEDGLHALSLVVQTAD
ncbi:BolA family transcriptional regulator [Amylibacter sp. SFDW26]|uniref:BolA family protein n=1 Tax=Amylibacter sp. SFDW26 TaxID=2652722 RepID=UPI001262A591|nr:BolA family protein [Amylibacter sp. SFDW26]KAB7610320.1 BolA family transcriptional regulator [Amylibacter sp. SFDW26]